ncbi:MAG TPA: MBL fold metallo-hydrolase [Candidatus Dormibacteraeota bacterium]|nr:MBL fold metallo-hydrolase [Candidatus Dormibacteraeota bacterium]
MPEAAPVASAAGAVTWLGHSTVLVELDGVRLLTDPVLRGRVGHLRRAPSIGSPPADVDAVLVSHSHFDHLDPPSLARLGRDQRIVVPVGAGRPLERRGFRRVEQVRAGEELRIGAVVVRATHAEHPGRRYGALGPPWRGAGGPRALGYVVTGRRVVYFAGDTDLFTGMSDLAPGLDLALLPVWGWGARVGRGHLDPWRAAHALRLLRPRAAVPIHWGTLAPIWWRAGSATGAEPALAFRRLARQVAVDVDVRVLTPGAGTWL